jgi:hypothetical protein
MSAMAGATGLRSWLQTHNMIGGSAAPVAHAAAHTQTC